MHCCFLQRTVTSVPEHRGHSTHYAQLESLEAVCVFGVTGFGGRHGHYCPKMLEWSHSNNKKINAIGIPKRPLDYVCIIYTACHWIRLILSSSTQYKEMKKYNWKVNIYELNNYFIESSVTWYQYFRTFIDQLIHHVSKFIPILLYEKCSFKMCTEQKPNNTKQNI